MEAASYDVERVAQSEELFPTLLINKNNLSNCDCTTYFVLDIRIHRPGAESNKINDLRCYSPGISYVRNTCIFPRDIPKKSTEIFLRHSFGVGLVRSQRVSSNDSDASHFGFPHEARFA